MKKYIQFLFLSFIITSGSCAFSQVTQQDVDKNWSGTATGTNSYSVTISKIISTVPYTFQTIYVVVPNTNTGASTIKVTISGGNSYAAIGITLNAAALIGGEIQAGIITIFKYDGSTNKWQMQPYAAGSGASSAWKITGNSGLSSPANFIGTIDNIPFNIRVNNIKAGEINRTLLNTFLGSEAGLLDITGTVNTGIGFGVLAANVVGTQLTATGGYALESNTTGNYNTANGVSTLDFNEDGSNNTASGFKSLYENISGNNNTASGYFSLLNNLGTGNTSVGANAGLANTTGTNNTYLGLNSGGNATITNACAIGANATVTASNSLILGSNANVGIGTSAPSTLLQLGSSAAAIRGKLGFAGNTSGLITIQPLAASGTYSITLPPDDGTAGQFLQTDGNGITTWQTVASATTTAWGLLGNSGTVDGTNFIGTTDNIPFNIRVNNEKSGRIDPTLLNSFYGYKSGKANTTGIANCAFGYESLLSNVNGNLNTATGYKALNLNVSGANNTANGAGALQLNIGDRNTAMGVASLGGNTGGVDNVSIGFQNMISNTNGKQNTSVGNYALSLDTADKNTAVGFQALRDNVDGEGNTAVGNNALRNNTNSFANTAVGDEALSSNNTGEKNTSIGAFTLGSNISGNNNTAIGESALTSNTVSDNTAVGFQALELNTTGAANTAHGVSALQGNIDGNNNTAVGFQALEDNSSTGADDNTALGSNALKINSAGYSNTGIGSLSLNQNGLGHNNTAIGYNSMGTNSDGTYNTAIGSDALSMNESGRENVALGSGAGKQVLGDGNIFLGFEAGLNETGSNKLYIDNNNTTTPIIYGDLSADILTINGSLGSIGLINELMLHTISTPTTTATVVLVENKYNIVNPAGTIAALTLKFPDSPTDNDFVEVKSTQIITTITYSAGTGAATIKGQVNGIVGTYQKWVYDSGTNTWY